MADGGDGWRGAALTYQLVKGRFILAGEYLYCTDCGAEEVDPQSAAPPFCAGCADSAGYDVDVCQAD